MTTAGVMSVQYDYTCQLGLGSWGVVTVRDRARIGRHTTTIAAADTSLAMAMV
jgi:hypothetical protein